MKKITFLLVLALIASFSFLSIQKASAQNPLPYFCEFNSQTQFDTWTVISSPGNTNPWRYSSSYTCAQFGYTPSSVQPDDWMISPAISIPAAGQYVVRYQYGTYSNSYTEKMKVFWGTAPTVSGQTNLIADYPSLTMGGSGSTWFDAEHIITVNAPGNIYLGFYSYSNPNAFYLFVRNVQVFIAPCAQPVTNLTLNYNENCNAVLNWTPQGTPIPPHNIYRDGALIASNVQAYSYIDDDFDVMESHVWEVAVACENGDESWHVSVAGGACDNGYTADCSTGNNVAVTGPGTATTVNYLPIGTYYNYSYSQQIFLESEVGATGPIGAISFQYIYATGQIKPNQTVYIGHTNKETFTSTSDWSSLAGFTKVFSGTVNYNNSSTWVTINFDTPFMYEGGNIIVAVVNNQGSFSTSSNATFRVHTLTPTSNYKALYVQNDSNGPYAPETTTPPSGTRQTNRTHTQFTHCSKLYHLHPHNVYGPGSMAILSPDPVPHGENATVNFVVDDCHYITDVIINGISQGPITSYNFGGLPITDLLPVIKIVTGTYQYTITSSCGANGTLSPLGSLDVDCGSEPTYTFMPNVGYEVNQIFIDGVAITLPEGVNIFSYTFPPVDDSHTIYVTFKKATWYINVTSSGCGNVYPGGNVGVPHNNTQIFTFYPNEGCKVTMVYVDGLPYPEGVNTGSYTFYYVTKPHTLEVVFDKKTYPVTANISAHGVINDQGTTYVEHGNDKTYTFYAMPGYEITYVKIDGYNNFNAVSAGTYTFENVTGPHTIDVIIAPKIYGILAEATVGGYITPQGNIQVAYQGNQAFTFEALPGYEIEKVLVDDIVNIEAVQNGAFAFLNVNDNHTIKVFFEVSKFKIMSAVYGIGGSIDPSGMTEISYFDNITYTITPEQDYKISHILVNGTNMGALETYTFSGVLTNGDIEAYFLYSPGGNDGEDDDDEELGVTNQNLDNISIYSRTNVVYIVNDNNLPISDISIFDMYGRIVWQGVPQGNSIALNAATGIYTVRVTSEGNFMATKVPIQR